VIQIFKRKLNKTLHVTITIDTWSKAESSRNFLGITVHFIANKARKIESGNIDIVKLFECTVDYTAYAILGILKKWCIDIDKVVAVVTNNESNVIFGQDRHIICFAIDLMAKNFIKNSKGFNLVNKVRSVVKFVKSSTNPTKELSSMSNQLGYIWGWNKETHSGYQNEMETAYSTW